MTLIVCLLILFVNNGTFLDLLQQRNVAVVDRLVVHYLSIHRDCVTLKKKVFQSLVAQTGVKSGTLCIITESLFMYYTKSYRSNELIKYIVYTFTFCR